MTRFADRADAGRALAAAVTGRVPGEAVVLALPRGGVPVAVPVAAALHAPLDVLVVRKLGVPWHPELAMGALAAGVTVVDPALVARLGVRQDDLDAVVERERAELARREAAYRGGRPPAVVAGRTAVVVDDGLATGSTALAAVRALRAAGAAQVVVAVPVGAPDAVDRVAQEADDVVCVLEPPGFAAVGAHYDDFAQTSDDEVREALDNLRGNGAQS